MKTEINIVFETLDLSELEPEDHLLYQKAVEAHSKAYAPYSEFKVGAALRLSNGLIITGNNQENAAYPSGLCAERVAIFSAIANYPDDLITDILVYALSNGTPVSPCGACRQVITEYEFRQDKAIRILMCDDKKVMIFKKSFHLLPLAFNQQNLKK